MSFDDEDKANATIIAPSMYRYLLEQIKDLDERDLLLDGYISTITDKYLTPKDYIKYDTKQIPQPYKKLGVRLSYPSVPYGAQPTIKERRTILLQFIGIEEGYKTIEVTKVGTQKEIASAY